MKTIPHVHQDSMIRPFFLPQSRKKKKKKPLVMFHDLHRYGYQHFSPKRQYARLTKTPAENGGFFSMNLEEEERDGGIFDAIGQRCIAPS